MLKLVKHSDLSWQDISGVECPETAKHIVQSLHNDLSHSIHGLGEYNIAHSGLGGHHPQLLDRLIGDLDSGHYFLINSEPKMPAVHSIDFKQNDLAIQLQPNLDFHPGFKFLLEIAIQNAGRPEVFAPVRDPAVNSSENESEQKEKKEKPPKHQIHLTIDADEEAWSPSEELTLVAFNVTQDKVQVKQPGRYAANPLSKLFVADKEDEIEVYAVHPEMKEVFHELKETKALKECVAKESIAKLECEIEEVDGTIQHKATLKIGPPLRFGVFFDGTGNDDKHSNKAEWSNVKLLSDCYEGGLKSKNESFGHGYIRGVGTEDDSFFTEILGGAGGFGAEARLRGMVFKIEEAIKKYEGKFEVVPKLIQLDVFGFSRGAAMARHFINVIKQGFYGFEDERLNRLIKPEHFTISFAGLFDTVGSFGIAGDNKDWGYNFHINSDWISGKVYHFIALNEYRENFDLQTLFIGQNRNYPKDMENNKMVELGFPGVHSDVGGGYSHNTHGISNGSRNPSMLSLKTLKRMHEISVDHNVPLKSLQTTNIESHLSSNHQTVMGTVRGDKDFRHVWMRWSAYMAQKDILNWKLENHRAYKERDRYTGHDGRNVKRRRDRVFQEIGQIDNKLAQIENRLENEMGSSQFQEFKNAYLVLYSDYIHRSHQPFNSTIGMDNEEIEEGKLERPHRTIFYKSEVNFSKRNDELDRIVYRNGRRQKIDRDEFEVIKSEEFD